MRGVSIKALMGSLMPVNRHEPLFLGVEYLRADNIFPFWGC